MNLEQMNFEDSLKFCHKLKSTILTPYTIEENIRLYDFVKRFAPICMPKNHATSFMWLGINDKEEEGVWRDLNVIILCKICIFSKYRSLPYYTRFHKKRISIF